MCTAINFTDAYHLFGRTLDVERSFGECTVIAPRDFAFNFCHVGKLEHHFAIVGMALVANGVPLFFDAMNEKGLCAAALKFPSAYYRKAQKGANNIASFELIPWLLASCADLKSALLALGSVNITDDSFSSAIVPSPLHYIVADRTGAAVIESTDSGIKIYDNPLGVLTNDPPFDYQLTRICDYASLNSAYPKNTLSPDTPLPPYSGGLGAVGLPGDFSSCSRFARAVFAKNHTLASASADDEINRFFHISDIVSVPRGCEKNARGESLFTAYTSCADTASGVYRFTTYNNRRIRAVPLFNAPLDSSRLLCFDAPTPPDEVSLV